MFTRHVTLRHRPLDVLLDNKLGSLTRGSYPLNHHGVEVGDVDPNTGTVTNLTRFELTANKKATKEKIKLKVVPNADPEEYKGISLALVEISGAIGGWTSYSNDEIEVLGDCLIKQHGTYRLFTNSCQHFALDLLMTICDAGVSKRGKYMYYLSEHWRDTSYFDRIRECVSLETGCKLGYNAAKFAFRGNQFGVENVKLKAARVERARGN